MTFVQTAVIFLILYLCIYALIDRVCKCIEHCATARAYSKSKENGIIVNNCKEKENAKETIH